MAWSAAPKIRKLSPEVAAKIRADIQVPCPARVAEELLICSLAAGASAVEVELQESSMGAVLTLSDDVFGRDMEALGQLAFEGFSAVCARCGRVVVRSKAPGERTMCKIFEEGRVTYFGPSDSPHGGPGATIRVEGLGKLSRQLEVSSLRQRLERQVLLRPEVSLRLHCPGKEAECLDLRSENAAARLDHVLGFGCARALCRVQSSSAHCGCALEGVVSGLDDAQSTDRFMYLFVNGRYVESCPIHESIVRLYAAASAASLQTEQGKGPNGQFCGPASVSAVAAGGAWPLFVLSFCCPEDWLDLTFSSDRSVIQFSNWRQPIRFIHSCLRNVWLHVDQHQEVAAARPRANPEPAGKRRHDAHGDAERETLLARRISAQAVAAQYCSRSTRRFLA